MMTEASFTEVFNLYYPKVYHHFLKRTRSAAVAREVAQLSFIKLWEFRHTLKDTISLDTQLFHIAAGVFIDHLRREEVRRRKVVEHGEERALEEAAPDGVFEASDHLLSLTRSLSPVRKRVFLLSRIQGHSYKEIAELLSISLKTVEDHMTKALRHIRGLY
ncbi:MAG: sigma-70 family RNA polymerase sigma factor [Bacteroidetes bacterium]|nr:sigma-70 family RNA polymerase sigma factor [Bacteroidota bacterium]